MAAAQGGAAVQVGSTALWGRLRAPQWNRDQERGRGRAGAGPKFSKDGSHSSSWRACQWCVDWMAGATGLLVMHADGRYCNGKPEVSSGIDSKLALQPTCIVQHAACMT